MDLNQIPLMGLITRRMEFLSARQKVLAQNVANADTPDFKPRDIPADAFARQVAQVLGSSGEGGRLPGPTPPSMDVAETDSHHLKGTLEVKSPNADPKRVDDYETTPSGTAVVLEEEMARLADIQTDHETMAAVYRKQVAFLKTALGRSSGS